MHMMDALCGVRVNGEATARLTFAAFDIFDHSCDRANIGRARFTFPPIARLLFTSMRMHIGNCRCVSAPNHGLDFSILSRKLEDVGPYQVFVLAPHPRI